MLNKIKYYIQAAIESFPVNFEKKEKLLEVIKVKLTGGGRMMYCMNCGKKITENAKFCTHCGKKVIYKGLVNSPDIGNLIFNARRGDTAAITILYEQTYSKVYYTVRSMIKDEDAIFDIVQDTYLKAFTHLDQFDGSDKFEPWVKQIAANTSRDWLKKKRPVLFSEMYEEADGEMSVEKQLVDDRVENLPEQVIDREETTRLIREILEELPEDQRAVIGMYYYEERSVKEIAQLMDTSESAVKSRLLYGRKKIEKKVKELEKKGTKLYSLAPIPFLLWLFRSENAYAAELPDATIRNAILEKMAVKTTSYSNEGATNAGETNKAGHTGKAANADKMGTAGKMGAVGKSGLFLGGSAAVKIGAVAVVAVALIGGSIFGFSQLNKKSVTPEETVAPVQESVESVVDSEETEKETVVDPETEDEGAEFLKIYSELIANAETYDYDCGDAKPTGIYRYALVKLEEEDEIPALLILQEADDYMGYARVFLYDNTLEEVLQPTDTLAMGVADVGGYRGDITTGEDQTQLQVTTVSAGTGAVNVYKILVSGDMLKYDTIASGTLGQEIVGVTYEDIKWFDISDRTGLDEYLSDKENVSAESKAESKSESKSSDGAEELPTDGDRLVLTGTVDILTYDEAVALQGCPDANAGYSNEDQTWTIIRLDAPHMLEGTQDISTWQGEYSVIQVSNSELVNLGIQEDPLGDYVGKHIIFSAGSYNMASDTSVPMGVPWAYDIKVLKVTD